MTTPPNTRPEDSLGPTHTALAQVVLVGGVLQVLASVALSLARVDELQSAIAEGPFQYLLGVFLAAIAITSVWWMRHRTAVALPLLLGWPVLVYLVIGRHASILGLAYHGEFILYHFLSLLCLALCIAVPLRWLRRPELGRARAAPLVLAGVGAGLLFVAHLAAIPSLRLPAPGRLGIAGGASLLLAWPVGLALLWRHASPLRLKLVAALLMLPLLLRVGLTGLDGLNGAPVPPEHVLALGICITIVATSVSFLFKPRIETWVRLSISALCLFSTLFFWLLYDRGFGELEDGFDGLIRSFLGFALPYPAYVSEWKVMGMMMAIFFISSTIYAALVSTRDRRRGVPLTMMALAGIGLTSPHLGLMLGAAALSFLDTLRIPEPEADQEDDDADTDAMPKRRAAPADDVERVLAATAARLGLDDPVALSEGRTRVVVVRGIHDGIEIDIRARRKRRWTLELSAGIAGRGTPTVELVPDRSKRGTRPAHPLARTHRIVGDPRVLETLGDRILDSLSSFPDARVRLWPGGCAVELGRDLARLDPDCLEAMVRAAAHAC